ncbi:FecR family protein [Sulfurimonas paralvinellae]|uniref:FecR domain-containing protein n=1 Tax=Sulfurimonas paralvinellae TaxID=317658 RepID=A0A7M1B5D2_9BACT|nr:FecR domain-containing protein [Sulfurimonas paralvinellae]QOP44947.1 FecR domain-containing protein [Sulfurimonas paralvinellae]
MKKIILLAMLVTMSFASIGKIAVAKGEAFVDRDTKAIHADNNMGILKKDILLTEDGRMQVIFKDNTVLSLGKKSRLIIEEYLYDQTNPQRVVATFKIKNGFVKAITGAIGKMMPQMFSIETAVAKITPQGTIWSVSVDGKSEHYVVSEGKIKIAFTDGSGKSIELKAGEAMTLNIKSKQGKKSVQSFAKKAVSTVSLNEGKIEQSLATVQEDSGINSGTVVEADGSVRIDINVPGHENNGYGHGNNGHGHGNHFGFWPWQ